MEKYWVYLFKPESHFQGLETPEQNRTGSQSCGRRINTELYFQKIRLLEKAFF